ncbi:MAG: SAM-dependent methyltransferase [Bacteriovoracaceae bacterium]
MTKVANPINKEDVDLNTYEGIAEFYDELMTKGYYDYDELTKELGLIIGERREILELGVGTGLVAELLLKVNKQIALTGIDNTEAMIKQAKDRLGDKINYELQDVTKLALPKKYEGAFSVGGCWYFIDNGTEKSLQLCSHIDDLETSKQGLRKVVEHLEPGGILALALQPAHTNYSKDLSNELTYSQEIFESPNGFTKHYCFKNKDKVVAEQMYSYLVVSENDSHDFFGDLGCKAVGLNSSRKFFIYQKG